MSVTQVRKTFLVKINRTNVVLDNCRIQRWAVNSTTGETIVGGTCGTNVDQLASAEFIFLDEDYNLIVVDRNNNRVAMFGLVN